MASLVLFDDARSLSPLTDLRASYELRTGALTTWQRIEAQVGRRASAVLVCNNIAPLLACRYDLPINRLPRDEEILLINGRWLRIDSRLPAETNTAIVDDRGSAIAALVDQAHAQAFLDAGCELTDDIDVEPRPGLMLLNDPWDIVRHCEQLIDFDLAGACRQQHWPPDAALGQIVIGCHPVTCGKAVRISPHVVLDATLGPIVIDDHAIIGPMVCITGPSYIGPHTEISAHAHIRTHTSIGPGCKVGGEIKSTIIEGHSNKAHYGYLGNSYVGEWVNLGAGTTTSNLKNTHGDVRMQIDPQGTPQPTALRMLGSIIGDHVRTAIGSRLLTGSCVHTAAMIAISSFCPKCVEPFAFLTDQGQERYQLERFVLAADRMMQRRNARVTAELAQRLAQLYVN